LVKSITRAAPTDCPASDDPLPLGSTGMRYRPAASSAACTSSTSFGMSTPTGMIWQTLASVA
jgi:hypothetical protein